VSEKTLAFPLPSVYDAFIEIAEGQTLMPLSLPRKTFNVKDVVEVVNATLADSYGNSEYRNGVRALCEHILHASGNYKGFRYLSVNDVPKGERPGINISPIDGQHLESYDARFVDTDSTRVAYYI
jgi:hypothetical protein